MSQQQPFDTKQDYLDEDVVTPNGQRFALVSFVGPDQRQKNEKLGMKIRGCFNTKEEAAAHVKKLQAFDSSVDIFMLDVGKWALIPPSVDDVDDVEYQEQYLQDLMKGYRESQAKAKELFQARQEAVMRDGVDAHLLPEERLPPPEDSKAGDQPVIEEITAGDVLKSIENTPSTSRG